MILEKDFNKAIELLTDLAELQNGSPLPTYEKHWSKTMENLISLPKLTKQELKLIIKSLLSKLTKQELKLIINHFKAPQESSISSFVVSSRTKRELKLIINHFKAYKS